MPGTMAFIMAGGESPALSVLTSERSAAAVSFAGKYRIIDFTLSNCINSGIYDVGVLTQHHPRSLHDHIGVGKPWDLDRLQGGVRVLHPWPTREGGGWQRGTADAIRYHLDILEERSADTVLVLGGDHIYKMDYRPLLAIHEQRGADVTVAVHTVPPHESNRYGMVTVDGEGRVTRFEEKPRRTSSSLASMGVYVFRKRFLINLLQSNNAADFGREMLPHIVSEAFVTSMVFNGYWADVGALPAYYEANMALLADTPALDLYDPDWVLRTRSEERPAAQLGDTVRVERSLICDGCRIEGTVINSVIGTGVQIGTDAVVRDSIIMPNTIIGPDSVIDRCIIDKRVLVGRNVRLGDSDNMQPNNDLPHDLNVGLTTVGKRAHFTDGIRIGRNVLVHSRAHVNRDTNSGTTVR